MSKLKRMWLRNFRHIPSPLPLIFIIVGTLAVILYGRGYRPDLKENTIKPTGLLSATSDPKGAQVYIDDTLITATDNTVNIEPGWYEVKISKEGYIPWQKKLRVQGEVVTYTDPFLFPKNPSLSPITTSGVLNPTLSPDGTKITYIVPLNNNDGVLPQKTGLWVYELIERPLGRNRDPQQVGSNSPAFDLSEAELIWSPDSSQILAITQNTSRLYNINRTDSFQNVTTTQNSILSNWEIEQREKELQKLAVFDQRLIDIATSSARIVSISPDETKILYESTASATIPQIKTPPLIGANPTEEKRVIESNKFYIYDAHEDKNFFVLDKTELPQPATSPSPSPISRSAKVSDLSEILQPTHWFPTNRHLVLTLPGKIDIMEYDRTNWVTVYSGPFIDGFMAVWPNGSRIIILTNLNPGVADLPNLYTVNLR